MRAIWCKGILRLRKFMVGLYLFFIFLTQAYAADIVYQIKASYIYNFLQFVSFPEDAILQSKIKVCILGRNYFGSTLDQIDGASTPQATIQVVYLGNYTSAATLSLCNVLYLTQSEKSNTRSILRNVDIKNVFTIAEYSPFISLGGLVELYIEEEKVRFRINRSLAKNVRFQISSQLLQLGTG